MIRVLLWDVDNTLLDFLAAERRALGDLRPVPPGPLPRGSGGTVRRPERQLLAPAGAGRDYQSPAASRPVSGVFPAGGALPAPTTTRSTPPTSVTWGDTVVFLDQSYDLVRDLRGRVKQYAVTNGTCTAQERKLARSGLGTSLTGCLSPEVVGRRSPA